MKQNKIAMLCLMLLSIIILSGCRQSEIVANNLDISAEEFELPRRIVAINGITDSPIFEVTGYCSIETANSYVSGTMEVICKSYGGYKKNFVYLSDNVMIVVEQLDVGYVPDNHYQIVFAPERILPIPKIV